MGIIGHETFTDGRRSVPPEEYEQELDPEPTRDDYLALAKDTTAYGLMRGRGLGERAIDIAKDKDRREAAASAAYTAGASAAVSAAGTAMVMSKGAVAAATAPGAADKAVGAASGAASFVTGKAASLF